MKLNDLKYLLLSLLALLMLMACGETRKGTVFGFGHGGEAYDSLLVINEVMANNRTGLCDESGEPAEWVEIKRLAANGEQLAIDGFMLAVKKNNGKVSTFPITWKQGEEMAIVFLKLPKKGACLQLLSPDGDVVSEVEYPALAADEAYARCDDGTYEVTRWQSPGFENDAEGYESYCRQIDELRNSPLLIWEVFSRAEKRKDCWVELKNVSNDTIDLTGFSLGKDMKKLTKVTELVVSPKAKKVAVEQLLPGQMMVVTLKLGDAETVVLACNGKFVDGVCAKSTYMGTSVGRTNDGKGFYFFASATRGGENKAHPFRYIAQAPLISSQGGKTASHDARQVISAFADSRVVRYTIDGSEPLALSDVFPDSLTISQTTVVRAFAEGDSLTMRSAVTTKTFMMDEPHTLPVVNITIDEADLYDYNRGIYADGPGYTSAWPHLGANYWKPWTRNAHVEFGDLSTDCGLKIFGGFSRYEAKKSFTVKFKNCYGNSHFTYDFFGTGDPVELNDLVLRSGSQDWNRCMVRDEFFTSLMAPHCPTLLIQAYRPVALYINGGYFGLYFLREKIDKHFVARKLGVSEDSITIVASSQYLEEGSKAEYKKLTNYIRSHNMAKKECYDYVRERVDLQGLIDFKLGEIYSGNTDVGNIRQVRSDDADCDGRWYFVFYDLDATWVGNKPTASYYLRCGSDAQQGGLHNRMINSLLANDEFRKLFMERLSLHMHKTFSPKNATAVFDALVNTIRPEMERNCERWPQLSYKQWEKNIEAFRARFADRHLTVLNDLRRLLAITPEEDKQYFSDL
ncbi:MAG: CotH kinase family protein [Bacteroidaceae bacterium]|nr:CotH kinase family protein [Bacteroidaceae bacterium]